MTPVTELVLEKFDHTDPELRGERYRSAMATLRGHDGWPAACPFGYLVLDRWHGNRSGAETDTFDIASDRERSRLLTFGAGIHYCVGANLARAEMEEALAFLGPSTSSRSRSMASRRSERRRGSTGSSRSRSSCSSTGALLGRRGAMSSWRTAGLCPERSDQRRKQWKS